MAGETDGLSVGSVDLQALAAAAGRSGPLWGIQSEDLNVTLLRFAADDGVAEHRNHEVDVLLVGIEGRAEVEVDGRREPLHPGTALLIPKGALRSIRSDGGPFAYLSCHRRRAGLWPGPKPAMAQP